MRKLMWFTIGFALACALGAYVCGGPWLMAGGAAAVFLAAGCWKWSQSWKSARVAGMVLLGLAVGLIWFWGYQDRTLTTAFQADGQRVDAELEITDYSWQRKFGSCADGKIILEGRPYKVRLYLKDDLVLVPGDRISGSFELHSTVRDGKNHYHPGQGIYLLGYQKGDISVEEARNLEWNYYPAYLRLYLKNRIDRFMPEDVSGYARALLLGDTTGIDYAVDSAFQTAGIRHIIAVSGLHVSILFAVVYVFAAKRRFLTGLLGIPVILLFGAVARFTPSVSRACIMQILMMISLMWGREYDPPTALSFACLTMLAARPMVITAVGFQLSVGCVAGILLFSARIQNWMMDPSRLGRWKGWRNRLARFFASSLSVSLGAVSLTTILSAIYFDTVSLISPLSNLLLLWAVSLSFYGIALTCVTGIFWAGGAALLGAGTGWICRYVMAGAELLARIPLASVYTCSVYISLWLAFAYLMILFAGKYRPAAVCSVILGLCVALLASWAEPMLDECRLTVVDVGQGQCVLFQSEGKTYMVDCGGDDPGQAADTASQILLSQGIGRLDGIVLTHFDEDHMGGIPNLLTQIPSDYLFLPGPAPQMGNNCRKIQVTGDLDLSYGNTKIRIFSPLIHGSDNDSGLCVLFQTENCDILITGDLSAGAEQLLLEKKELPDLEVYVAGHHGSRYSSSDELLDALRPDTVLISAGAHNRYGHPAPELLERLYRHGCTVYRTDQDGTIIYKG